MIDVGASVATARAWVREQNRAELQLRVRLAEAESRREDTEHHEREWTRTLAHMNIHDGDEP